MKYLAFDISSKEIQHFRKVIAKMNSYLSRGKLRNYFNM